MESSLDNRTEPSRSISTTQSLVAFSVDASVAMPSRMLPCLNARVSASHQKIEYDSNQDTLRHLWSFKKAAKALQYVILAIEM